MCSLSLLEYTFHGLISNIDLFLLLFFFSLRYRHIRPCMLMPRQNIQYILCHENIGHGWCHTTQTSGARQKWEEHSGRGQSSIHCKFVSIRQGKDTFMNGGFKWIFSIFRGLLLVVEGLTPRHKNVFVRRILGMPQSWSSVFRMSLSAQIASRAEFSPSWMFDLTQLTLSRTFDIFIFSYSESQKTRRNIFSRDSQIEVQDMCLPPYLGSLLYRLHTKNIYSIQYTNIFKNKH